MEKNLKSGNHRLLVNSFPELAREYSSKNIVAIDAITTYSGRQVIWKCSTIGHEWDRMTVSQRTRQGQGCPYCSNRRLLVGFNDLMSRYPDLIEARWDFTRNSISPKETYGKAKEKFFWLCEMGHSYTHTIHSELSHGCGVCSSHLIQNGVNDAFTAATKEVRKSWSMKNSQPLTHYGASSPYNGLWICPNSHEYRSPIGRRLNGGGNCPICLNRKLLVGFNDLKTCHPSIAIDFDETLNGRTVESVVSGSSIKYWWRCQDNPSHTWRTTPALRISQHTSCPHCRVSKLETEVADWVSSANATRVIRGDRTILSGLELDIVVPILKIAIEVNGVFWHSDNWVRKTKGVDARTFHKTKQTLSEELGFQLLFVWEDDWMEQREKVKDALALVFMGNKPDSVLTTLSKG